MRMLRFNLILAGLAVLMLTAACSGGPSFPLPEGVESPCDLTEARVGEQVMAGGEVITLDDSDSTVLYADLEADDCRIGISVERSVWETWGVEERATFSVGARIVVEGLLETRTLPANPDEKELTIAISAIPEAMESIPALSGAGDIEALPPLIGVACKFLEEDSGTIIPFDGILVGVDTSAAAGVYAELDNEGCALRLWVERTQWNTWDPATQALFRSDTPLMGEGVLTLIVENEVINLTSAPERAD